MVLEKCHFDDLFKKVISQIEDEFDKDFDDGFPLTLEGVDNLEVRLTLQKSALTICEQYWDKTNSPMDHDKSYYQRLIYEMVVFLLYMLKESTEEKMK